MADGAVVVDGPNRQGATPGIPPTNPDKTRPKDPMAEITLPAITAGSKTSTTIKTNGLDSARDLFNLGVDDYNKAIAIDASTPEGESKRDTKMADAKASFELATRDLESFLKTNPNSSLAGEAQFLLGASEFFQGNYSTSQTILRAVLNRPDTADAQFHSDTLLYLAESSFELRSTAVPLSASDQTKYYDQASADISAYLKSQTFKAGEKELPAVSEMRLRLGQLKLETAKLKTQQDPKADVSQLYTEAAESYQQARQGASLEATYQNATIGLAQLHEEQQQIGKAIELLEDPRLANNSIAQLKLGINYARDSNTEPSVAVEKLEALTKSGNLPGIYQNEATRWLTAARAVARADQAKSVSAAAEDLAELNAKYPQDPIVIQTTQRLAVRAANFMEYPAAEKLYAELAKQPLNTEYHQKGLFYGAMAMYDQGKFAESAAELEKFRTAYGSSSQDELVKSLRPDAEYYAYMANYRAGKSPSEQAIKEMLPESKPRIGTELFSLGAVAYNQRANLFAQASSDLTQDKLDELTAKANGFDKEAHRAFSSLVRDIETHPDRQTALNAMVNIFARTSDWSALVEHVEKYPETLRENQRANVDYGEALLRRENQGAGEHKLQDYNKAVEVLTAVKVDLSSTQDEASLQKLSAFDERRSGLLATANFRAGQSLMQKTDPTAADLSAAQSRFAAAQAAVPRNWSIGGDIRIALGTVYLAQENWSAAKNEFTRALAYHKNVPGIADLARKGRDAANNMKKTID